MFVDKFGQVRGKSNNAVGSPTGLENIQPGVPAPIVPLEAPYLGTSHTITITRSADVATAADTGHGYAVGQIVRVAGADQYQYNGDKRVDSTPDANSWTFAAYGTPTTPATGTITCKARLIEAVEDTV